MKPSSFRTILRTAACTLALLLTASVLVSCGKKRSAEEELSDGKAAYSLMDFDSAAKHFALAAKQGNAEAQYNLGVCYEYGEGVENDMKEAVKWYRKAAEQGFTDALNNLGACYANGNGVENDMKEAVKWFRKAAEQNDAVAQFNLGVSYEKGDGVEKDMNEALNWYRKAAEQGEENAKSALERLTQQAGRTSPPL